jgi:cob(I)alamin adenosyltransferase
MREGNMFNHAFDIAFEVITDKEEPDEVTEQELIKALEKRIKSLKESGDIDEAVSCYDSYEF